jgi:hypothetical protein
MADTIKCKVRLNLNNDILLHNQLLISLVFVYFLLTQTNQMFTDLGGILGLWLGFAFFSTFEVLEFIVDIFALFVARWFCGRTPVYTVAPYFKPKAVNSY